MAYTLIEDDAPAQPKRGGYVFLPDAKPVSKTDKFLRGMMDPIDGGAQLLSHMLPDGANRAINSANNFMAQYGLVAPLPDGGIDEMLRAKEADYQASRRAAGESGLDGWRIAGNVASPVNVVAASSAPRAVSLLGRAASAAGVGAIQSGLSPVVEGGDFATVKAKQIGIGGAAGGLLGPITGATARIVKPEPSKSVGLLVESGVKPTIGQRFGQFTNATEEKLQSVPLIGDLIRNARMKTREEFNAAALNRALDPIGQKSNGIGTSGFSDANAKIGAIYEQAKSMMGGFKVDPQGNAEINNLIQMTRALPDKERAAFDGLVNTMRGQMSQNGSFLADTFKRFDSELGLKARQFAGSPDAYQQQVGDAIKELQRALMENAKRAHPDAAALMNKADEAYANLVRVEGATKAAANSDGVFTPAQLMQGVKTAESSVRKRGVAKGSALMQDLAQAGQEVIGNKVPNSGTTDRALLAALTGGGLTYLNNPIAWGVGSMAAAPYVPGIRQAIHALTTQRPQFAAQAANYIRGAAPYAIPIASPLLKGLLE